MREGGAAERVSRERGETRRGRQANRFVQRAQGGIVWVGAHGLLQVAQRVLQVPQFEEAARPQPQQLHVAVGRRLHLRDTAGEQASHGAQRRSQIARQLPWSWTGCRPPPCGPAP